MIELHHGDCLEILRGMPDNSVDSIVTDPPYGLSFMGKRWDYDVPSVEVWAECLRVLKPGGHLLAFAGTRTQHRMAVRIEDAGFEIRDMIAWVYGSGFPKSLDVSKAIDKKANELPVFDAIRAHIREWRDRKGYDNKALNEATGSSTNGCGMARHWTSEEGGQHAIPSKDQWRKLKVLLGWPDCEFDAIYDAVKEGPERPVVGQQRGTALAFAPGQGNDRSATALDITAPATEAARQWQGWGTALKPALEPITVARKPLVGTVAENVLQHGTGAINVDGCRVSTAGKTITPNVRDTSACSDGWSRPWMQDKTKDAERQEKAYDAMQALGRWPANLIHDGSDEPTDLLGDAARFFYCAKASKRDRDEGLEGFTPAKTNDGRKVDADNAYQRGATLRANTHPTVKPTDLMRYLCRLVTPPGGVVLDPFMGSGSTGKAAVLEGFRFIGCEREDSYVEIARARIQASRNTVEPAERDAESSPDATQRDLFEA